MAQSIDTASIYKTTAGRSAIMAWYDAKIKAFSITTESQDVSIQAGQTHITIAGENDAPPLIVLHGGFMNGVSMESVIVHFSKNHRVYAIDIIGMPGKSAETRLSVKGNDYSEWLVEVMQQLGLEKSDFLALSFGGWHLLKLASLWPERINRAVLLAPSGLISGRVKGRLLLMSSILQCRLFNNEKSLTQAAIRPFYAKGSTPDIDIAKLMGLGFKHIKLDPAVREASPFTKEELVNYIAPTMIIFGEQDNLHDAEAATEKAREIISNLVNSEIIAGQGHFLGKEIEDKIYNKVDAFFGTNSS